LTLAPFITVQDLTDRLGRDVSADPGAASAVDSACAICRIVAEQDFNGTGGTVTLDGTGTDALLLPQRPVTAVAGVQVNGAAITDYVLSAQGALFRGTAGARASSSPTWPLGRQNVQVVYSAGYQTLAVPADVCEVALNVAMRAVAQGIASAETVGDVQISYSVGSDDLTTNELRILERYRGARSF
jgi:hypothetical protein